MLSTHSCYGMIQWFNMPFEQSWQWFMWFSKHWSEKDLDERIADYNKNISSHLRSLNASEQTKISESTLILSCSRVFVSPVLITTFKISQVDRDRFGMYWKSNSIECKHPINEDSKKCWPGMSCSKALEIFLLWKPTVQLFKVLGYTCWNITFSIQFN